MKILLLNGSPRPNGNTAAALDEMEAVFAAEGLETERVQVGNRVIRGCIACGKWAGLGRCVFDDLVNELAPKLEACDGLVVGSPVYYAEKDRLRGDPGGGRPSRGGEEARPKGGGQKDRRQKAGREDGGRQENRRSQEDGGKETGGEKSRGQDQERGLRPASTGGSRQGFPLTADSVEIPEE